MLEDDDIESDNSDDEENIIISKCTKCFKSFEIYKTKNGNDSKRCRSCAKVQEKADASRNAKGPRKRDWKGEMERNPERAQKKKDWKDENYDKVAGYWADARARQIEKEGDDYWNNRAVDAKKWRGNNKEKVEESNKKRRYSCDVRISSEINRAHKDGIKWDLDTNYAKELISNECFYCNGFNETSINGIDRFNNDIGYTMQNAIPCCDICNTMKSDFNIITWTHQIEHILTIQKKINGKLYPDATFDCPRGGDYSSSKRNAVKDYVNDIGKDEFINLTKNNCYYCDKSNTPGKHHNGVDRVNSNIGYKKDNCVSCCGFCNKIINKYDWDIVTDKFLKIYNNKNKILLNECSLKEFNKSYSQLSAQDRFNVRQIMKNRKNYYAVKMKESRERRGLVKKSSRKKLTKEELKEAARLRKQKSRIKMREKYGNEEWKRQHALERAAQRKAQKT